MALLDKTKFGYSASKMPFGIHYSWVIVAVLGIVQVFDNSVFMIAGVMVPPMKDPEDRLHLARCLMYSGTSARGRLYAE